MVIGERKLVLHLVRSCAVLGVVAAVGLDSVRNALAEDRVPKTNAARQVTGPVREAQQLAAGGEATLEFRLTPMVTYPGYPGGTYNTGGAYDQSNISGQTLHVTQGGFVSYWNVQFANWDPDPAEPVIRLEWFFVEVDDRTYSSGDGAPLTYANVPCAEHTQCEDYFGEAGSYCRHDDYCQPWWIHRFRSDAFEQRAPCDVTYYSGCNIAYCPWWPYFVAEAEDEECSGVADTQTTIYVGSIALYVPPDAYGTYTIDFLAAGAVDIDGALLPLAARLPGVLIVDSGACCRQVNPFSTVCEENVGSVDCACAGCTWHDQATCADAACAIELGACCDSGSEDPQVSTCSVATVGDCSCEKCTCTPQAACEHIICNPNFIAIPATSQWGLVVMTMLLLIAGKLYFYRRPVGAARAAGPSIPLIGTSRPSSRRR